jgi:hydrogenase nickel incorporation protein HypA/HybF
MHEISVAEELIRIVIENAEKAGIKKVSEVNLRIGELSCIVPDSLQFAFEVLSQDKITQGAKLNIERTQPRFECHQCHSVMSGNMERCGECGSDEIRVIGGDDLQIVSFVGD